MTQPPTGGPDVPPSGPPPHEDASYSGSGSTPPTPPAAPQPETPQVTPATPQPETPQVTPATPAPVTPATPAPVASTPEQSAPSPATSPLPTAPGATGSPVPPPGVPAGAVPHPAEPVPGVPADAPPHPAAAPPRKKRGLLIASIAFGLAVLLCGGGGLAAFLVLRNTDRGEGAAEPAAAVEGFLTAVYRNRDAAEAARLVCVSARDEQKLAAKVAEVEKYVNTYQEPRFTWSTPQVDTEAPERAVVSTKLTVTTADEKVATQELRFTVIQETGWWVCEVG